MDNAFQTGPGFYGANTKDSDRHVPEGKMRVYCARLEAYDLDADVELDLEVTFDLLFSKAENDPQVARALLLLGEAITGNRSQLEKLL